MTLQDIYNQLSYGELRLLFLGGKDIDNPNTTGMPIESFLQLLPSVQLGLSELHKRFALREGHFDLIIQSNAGILQKTYLLTDDYAVSNVTPNSVVRYINDAEMPFTNNLHKVLRCFGTYNAAPWEIALNEVANPAAIRTSSWNSITIPTDSELAPWLLETDTIEVVYRANHPEINHYIANSAPLVTPIYLPDTHLEPLLFYIASRVYNPVGMTPGAMHEGNNYWQKFEQSCAQLKLNNYEIDNDSLNDKLIKNGFC